MLQLSCSGNPYEIGFKHGSEAKAQVLGSIRFYDYVFQTLSKMTWPEVRKTAEEFVKSISKKYPRYLEEMKGIADGADVPFVDIVALNIRSEIAFSTYPDRTPEESDGCTSLGWYSKSGKCFLAQNWDWMQQQQSNLIILHIYQPGTDLISFKMITEAGIIGKIGLNEKGVGCCLNAIRARGVDFSRMPVHFGLRTVLESPTKEVAIQKIKAVGLAASAHILIGDTTGIVGLECTHFGFGELHPDEAGRICHANNLILDFPGVDEHMLPDSPGRTRRMLKLATSEVEKNLGLESILELFKDEDNFPTSINRCQEGKSRSATLFNIVLDLNNCIGVVSLGRPTSIIDKITIQFH